MSELLDSLIDDIRKRARAKDPTAVERAAQLAEQYPDEPRGWRVLAFAHEMNDDMDGAVAAMTRMIEIAPPEPMLFFFGGMTSTIEATLRPP
jgi:cytochrome c-type biogenesis protein CcmH/NrfG